MFDHEAILHDIHTMNFLLHIDINQIQILWADNSNSCTNINGVLSFQNIEKKLQTFSESINNVIY